MASAAAALYAIATCVSGVEPAGSPPACPAPLDASSLAVRTVKNAKLWRELQILVDTPIASTVHRYGGIQAFGEVLERMRRDHAARAQRGEHSDADARTAHAVLQAVHRAAQCVVAADDPRRAVERGEARFPLTAIGAVRKRLGHGTGTLVGRCLVLTSEHVVSGVGSHAADIGESATFLAGVGELEGGFAEWVRAEIIALGQTAEPRHPARDWALLRLDRPLGDTYGYVDLAVVAERVRHAVSYRALGFPGDGAAVSGGYRRLWIHEPCRFLGASGDAWGFDCVAGPGQSGGPVFARGLDGGERLVAMLSASRKISIVVANPPAHVTVATATSAFNSAVDRARRGDCPVIASRPIR